MPTVTIDGEQHDVSYSDIELGEDESPNKLPGVQAELDRVAGKTRSAAKQSAEQDLLEDEDFFRKAAQRRGIELAEDGTPKGTSKEMKELKKELAKAKQKAEQVEDLEGQLSKVRDARLESTILQSVDGIKDDVKDIFLQDAKSRFTYDADEDAFYPVDENGNTQYGRSVGDVLESIREDRPSLFKDTQMNGGPDNTPGGGSGTPSFTREQVKDITARMKQGDPEAAEQFEKVKEAHKAGRIE